MSSTDKCGFDLDEGGWLGTSPRTPQRLSWRNDPLESHSDWTIRVRSATDGDDGDGADDEIYRLHRNVLSNGKRASGYFHAQFSQRTNETRMATTVLDDLPGECSSRVPQLLDFIYEGRLELDEDAALPMMELARRLDVPALGRKCMDWIGARLSAEDVDFALKALLQGGELCMEKVCAASLKVVAGGFDAIDKESLLCLTVDRLVQLLWLDELNAFEDQVFDLIVAYIDSNTLPKADAQRLWLCCRFANLSSEKKLEALQQDSLPREAFFEDAVACLVSRDVGANNELDGYSPECKHRMKRRKFGNELTENSKLVERGVSLATDRGLSFQVLPESSPNSDLSSHAKNRTKRRKLDNVLTQNSKLVVKGVSLATDHGLSFKVLPESSPKASKSIQLTNYFQIPEGWRVVKTSDVDFERIRKLVITRYSWGTDFLHVRHDYKFKCFHSKGSTRPGIGHNRTFIKVKGNAFQFTSGYVRLLLRNK